MTHQPEENVREVQKWLGIAPDEAALWNKLTAQIGDSEVAVARAAVEFGPADRREHRVAGVVCASRAIGQLGSAWWSTAKPRPVRAWGVLADDRSPAALIRSEQAERCEQLGYWAQDDEADSLWGPTDRYVDMNDQSVIDRIPPPIGSRAGDAILFGWDPGCRGYATVVERGDRLGTTLQEELLWAPSADLWWAWVAARKVS